MCSGRSRKPQRRVRPSIRPSVRPIHFSSANQIRVFVFSVNREPPLIPGGRFDWLCDLPSLIHVDQLEREIAYSGWRRFQATWPRASFLVVGSENEEDSVGRDAVRARMHCVRVCCVCVVHWSFYGLCIYCVYTCELHTWCAVSAASRSAAVVALIINLLLLALICCCVVHVYLLRAVHTALICCVLCCECCCYINLLCDDELIYCVLWATGCKWMLHLFAVDAAALICCVLCVHICCVLCPWCINLLCANCSVLCVVLIWYSVCVWCICCVLRIHAAALICYCVVRVLCVNFVLICCLLCVFVAACFKLLLLR